MKKQFKLKDLGCANCAAKMEHAIQKIEGVTHASVNFMHQKLSIEADDARFDEIMEHVEKIIRKIEPECEIVS